MKEVQDNAQLGQEMPEIASNEALDFYHAFFDLFGFIGAREELERLMEAAFNEEYVSKHRCPAGLIMFYEQMVQLVETAFAGLSVYQQVAGNLNRLLIFLSTYFIEDYF